MFVAVCVDDGVNGNPVNPRATANEELAIPKFRLALISELADENVIRPLVIEPAIRTVVPIFEAILDAISSIKVLILYRLVVSNVNVLLVADPPDGAYDIIMVFVPDGSLNSFTLVPVAIVD
jgi:hypothetical protein